MNEKQYYKQQRNIVFERDNFCCQVCKGEKCKNRKLQVGHILPCYKYLKKKYGYKIIHHNSNLITVGDIDCNKKVELKIKGGASEMEQVVNIIHMMMKE